MPLFVSGNVKAGAVKQRIIKVVKSLYSLGSALGDKCQLNNCFYLLKKRFAKARM